jgi:hypothetical protein
LSHPPGKKKLEGIIVHALIQEFEKHMSVRFRRQFVKNRCRVTQAFNSLAHDCSTRYPSNPLMRRRNRLSHGIDADGHRQDDPSRRTLRSLEQLEASPLLEQFARSFLNKKMNFRGPSHRIGGSVNHFQNQTPLGSVGSRRRVFEAN